MNESFYTYENLMYLVIGAPLKDSPNLPTLREAIDNVIYNRNVKNRKYKPDYELISRNRKKIGERGESFILGIEIKRLIELGCDDLANKVSRVSEKDDSAGYDILSYEKNGDTRYIEVKSTSQENFDHGFYITANEISKSKELTGYYLYLVTEAMSEKPDHIIYPNPDFEHDFAISPIKFRAKSKL